MQTNLESILSTIEQRANAATAGPWAKDWGRVRGDQCETICLVRDQVVWDQEPWIADSTFIAASRTDIPALVKALRRAMDFYSWSSQADFYHAELASILSEQTRTAADSVGRASTQGSAPLSETPSSSMEDK